MRAFFVVVSSFWFPTLPDENSCSIRLLSLILVPLGECGVGTSLTKHNGAEHGEGEAEEKGPEGDDLNEQPVASELLDIFATLAVVTHVYHVDDCVDYKSEKSVASGYVPCDSPVNADADNSKEDSRPDPLNDVINGEHKKWEIEDFTRLFAPCLDFSWVVSADSLANHESVFVWVEIDNGHTANELDNVPKSNREAINESVPAE